MDDNRQQMIAQIKALKELQRRRAKRTFHDFLQYVNPKYEMKWYHRLIADPTPGNQGNNPNPGSHSIIFTLCSLAAHCSLK